MPRILSRQIVQDEFVRAIPSDISAPMRACLIGPEAELHRYSVAAEKADIDVGEYVPASDTTYDWPEQGAGTLVDLDSPRVFIDDALLQYFTDAVGSGLTIAPVANTKNRIIISGSAGLAENGEDYPRLAALKDRDVAVGDIVYLVDGSNTQTTYVSSLVADQVGAAIGTPLIGDDNAVAQPSSYPGAAPTVNAAFTTGGSLATGVYFVRYSWYGAFGETWASAAQTFTLASPGDVPRVTIPSLPTNATAARIYLSPVGGTALQCTLYATAVAPTTYNLVTAYAAGGAAYLTDISQTAGTDNDVNATAISVSSFDGLSTGDITDTYTITCIQASTGGDATTAILQVSTASGNDDDASVTPAAFASPTSIGARGVTVTFANTSDNFVIGQTWVTQVRMAFSRPTVAAGGTYTGQRTLSYLVRVSLGGTFAGATKPQITWTTDVGIDPSSAATNVTTSGAAVTLGTLGATITFTGAALSEGDVYSVPITGPTDGAYRTILLANNLTTALQASSDMAMTLYLKKDIEVPAARVSDPGTFNWVAEAGSITVNAGVDAYDSTLTDSGTQFSVPVKGGTVYIDYRAWRNEYAGGMSRAATQEDVDDFFGDFQVPDNPLAYAMKQAMILNRATDVYFIAIADPSDMTEWQEALDMLEGQDIIRSLVPLTRDQEVWDMFRAHVLARSADTVGGEYRTVWMSPEAVEEVAIVDETTSSDTEQVNATLADDPDTSGTQYTYLTVTTDNGQFVTLGVLPGDVVRYQYAIDIDGQLAYSEYVVEEVVNEDTIRLVSGPDAAVSTAGRVEVWRNRRPSAVATALVTDYPTADPDQRFYYVWPDSFTDDDGETGEGYVLAAMMATFVGAVAPQQGIREIQISGVSAMPRSTQFFNNGHLNTLAEGGFFVMTMDPVTGSAYTKAANSSDVSEIDTREEVVVRRDDAIRYAIYNAISPYFGKSSLGDTQVDSIKADIEKARQHVINDTLIERVGPLAIDLSLQSIGQSSLPGQQDRISVVVLRVAGTPLNAATITVTS